MPTLSDAQLHQLPAKHLKSWLNAYGISNAGCIEKDDYIRVIINTRINSQHILYYRQHIPSHANPKEQESNTGVSLPTMLKNLFGINKNNQKSSRKGSSSNSEPASNASSSTPSRAQTTFPQDPPSSSAYNMDTSHSSSRSHEASRASSMNTDSSSSQHNTRPTTGMEDFFDFASIANELRTNGLGPFMDIVDQLVGEVEEAPPSSSSRQTAPPPPNRPQARPTTQESVMPFEKLLSLTPEAVHALSVKSLKQILAFHRVSSDKIVEKPELEKLVLRIIVNERLDRNMDVSGYIPKLGSAVSPNPTTTATTTATSPESPPSSSNQQAEIPNQNQTSPVGTSPVGEVVNVPDEDLCKICFEKRSNAVILECGHLCACIDCSKQLKSCPICRNHITRIVHTFRV